MNSARLGFVILQVSQLWGEWGTKDIRTMTKTSHGCVQAPPTLPIPPTLFYSKVGRAAQAAPFLYPLLSQLKHLLSISCTQPP